VRVTAGPAALGAIGPLAETDRAGSGYCASSALCTKAKKPSINTDGVSAKAAIYLGSQLLKLQG